MRRVIIAVEELVIFVRSTVWCVRVSQIVRFVRVGISYKRIIPATRPVDTLALLVLLFPPIVAYPVWEGIPFPLILVFLMIVIKLLHASIALGSSLYPVTTVNFARVIVIFVWM